MAGKHDWQKQAQNKTLGCPNGLARVRLKNTGAVKNGKLRVETEENREEEEEEEEG